MTIDSLVREFHEAMNIPVADKLGVPADERVRLRARLICEELIETMHAMFPSGWADIATAGNALAAAIATQPEVDLPELADGLCDLDYVVAGTRLEFGIDGEAVLAEVQRSNMSKVGGPMREDGKVMKGPNYSPPDIAGVLDRQRAKGSR